MSIRQIIECFEIFADLKSEEFELQAALHGCDVSGKSKQKDAVRYDRDGKASIDVRNIKSAEEWNRIAKMVNNK